GVVRLGGRRPAQHHGRAVRHGGKGRKLDGQGDAGERLVGAEVDAGCAAAVVDKAGVAGEIEGEGLGGVGVAVEVVGVGGQQGVGAGVEGGRAGEQREVARGGVDEEGVGV